MMLQSPQPQACHTASARSAALYGSVSPGSVSPPAWVSGSFLHLQPSLGPEKEKVTAQGWDGLGIGLSPVCPSVPWEPDTTRTWLGGSIPELH